MTEIGSTPPHAETPVDPSFEFQSRRQMNADQVSIWNGGEETHYDDAETVLSRINPEILSSPDTARAVGAIAMEPSDQPLTRQRLADVVPLKKDVANKIVRQLLMGGLIVEGPPLKRDRPGEYPATLHRTEDFDAALSMVLSWRRAAKIRELMQKTGKSEAEVMNHRSLKEFSRVENT